MGAFYLKIKALIPPRELEVYSNAISKSKFTSAATPE